MSKMMRIEIVLPDKNMADLLALLDYSVVKHSHFERAPEHDDKPEPEQQHKKIVRKRDGKRMEDWLAEKCHDKGWFSTQAAEDRLEALGYARSSASSALSKLKSHGFAERNSKGEWRIKTKVPDGYEFKLAKTEPPVAAE